MLIKLYRIFTAGKLPSCRYLPTCSQYAMQAIEEKGFVLGIYLGIKRILRCHPFGGFGYDPVPESKSDKN